MKKLSSIGLLVIVLKSVAWSKEARYWVEESHETPGKIIFSTQNRVKDSALFIENIASTGETSLEIFTHLFQFRLIIAPGFRRFQVEDWSEEKKQLADFEEADELKLTVSIPGRAGESYLFHVDQLFNADQKSQGYVVFDQAISLRGKVQRLADHVNGWSVELEHPVSRLNSDQEWIKNIRSSLVGIAALKVQQEIVMREEKHSASALTRVQAVPNQRFIQPITSDLLWDSIGKYLNIHDRIQLAQTQRQYALESSARGFAGDLDLRELFPDGLNQEKLTHQEKILNLLERRWLGFHPEQKVILPMQFKNNADSEEPLEYEDFAGSYDLFLKRQKSLSMVLPSSEAQFGLSSTHDSVIFQDMIKKMTELRSLELRDDVNGSLSLKSYDLLEMILVQFGTSLESLDLSRISHHRDDLYWTNRLLGLPNFKPPLKSLTVNMGQFVSLDTISTLPFFSDDVALRPCTVFLRQALRAERFVALSPLARLFRDIRSLTELIWVIDSNEMNLESQTCAKTLVNRIHAIAESGELFLSVPSQIKFKYLLRNSHSSLEILPETPQQSPCFTASSSSEPLNSNLSGIELSLPHSHWPKSWNEQILSPFFRLEDFFPGIEKLDLFDHQGTIPIQWAKRNRAYHAFEGLKSFTYQGTNSELVDHVIQGSRILHFLDIPLSVYEVLSERIKAYAIESNLEFSLTVRVPQNWSFASMSQFKDQIEVALGHHSVILSVSYQNF